MKIKEYNLPNDRKLEIHQDDTAESPREWDNNGVMVCFHRRYNLGEKHEHSSAQDFLDWRKEQGDKIIAILPLYLYDHSGLSISTGEFSCPWDSGQVGWIYASRESLESGGHNVDEIDVQKVEEWLRGEVKTYDQFLRGDVYGFIVREAPCEKCGGEGKSGDSCWGFYGDDPTENGMSDHLAPEDREALNTAVGILSLHSQNSGSLLRLKT
jgi:hypothetical protein